MDVRLAYGGCKYRFDLDCSLLYKAWLLRRSYSDASWSNGDCSEGYCGNYDGVTPTQVSYLSSALMSTALDVRFPIVNVSFVATIASKSTVEAFASGLSLIGLSAVVLCCRRHRKVDYAAISCAEQRFVTCRALRCQQRLVLAVLLLM